MKLTHEYTSDLEPRIKYIAILMVSFLLVVVVRLYYLQILRGDHYRFFSTENSIKESKIPAVRGVVFDKDGRILVESRPAFDVVAIPQYVLESRKVLSTLSRYLKIPVETLEASWEKRKNQPSYQPVIFKKDVSRDEIALILTRKGAWYNEEGPDDLRGVEVVVHFERSYSNGELAPHVFGYVKEIDGDNLKEYSELYPGRYSIGDRIGINGLEKVWDLDLRGYDGYEQHVVNAVGKEVDFEGVAEHLEQRPTIAGNSLYLTIDEDIQAVAQSFFAKGDSPSSGKSGAAVMIDVETGGVLAMYSSPAYDLNALADAGGGDYWLSVAADRKNYLINRAIQGAYPPASTYKVVTAIAGLSEKVVKLDEQIYCSGAYFFGGRPYRCWREGGHGYISLKDAISQSCDVYFYIVGKRLGVDRLAKYAKLLGLGSRTGISLPDERSGLIPTSDWKIGRFNVPWQEGETLSVAVGQSYNLVTPLQNALVAAQIANGGKAIEPHIVDHVISSNGEKIYQWAPQKKGRMDIPKDVLDAVKEGMVGAVASPSGTAHRLSKYKFSVGGKTGTAQVVALEANANCRGDKCRDHAWFICFAPTDKPKVAAAVLVEHGGFGASASAPIAGAMLEKYFEKL